MQTIYAEQIELLLKNDTSTCEKVGAEGHISHWTDKQFTPLQSMFWNSSSSRNNAYKSIWSSVSRYDFSQCEGGVIESWSNHTCN